LANPVAAAAVGACQFVAGLDQQGKSPIRHWSRAPMRRIFVLRSTAGPSKVQCFGTTASCSLNHLPPITIRADDRSQKVGTGGPCSAIVACSCDVLNRNRQCGAECKPHDDQSTHRRPAVGAAVGATTDAYVRGSVCAFTAAVVFIGLLCVLFRV